MAERGRHRREAVVVAASVVVLAALFAVDAARGTGRYEAHVDFAMEVPLPAAHWDPELGALTPTETIERAAAFAEADAVRGAIEAELTYEYRLDVEVVDDQTLRFTGEADSPELAVNTATAAAAIYGQQRVRAAQESAAAAMPELEDAVAAATGTEREDAQRRLNAAEDTIELGPAGGPTGEAAEPCCPVREPVVPALLLGAGVGLLLGIVLVGLWRLEHRLADHRRRRAPSPAAPDASRWAAPWLGPAVVGGLVGARALYYAVLGPRLILDDWLLTYRAEFYGIARAVPEAARAAQPTKWAWLTAVFAVADGRPLVLFALVTLVNLAAALALYYALARFFAAPIPVLVTGLWVITANHSALTVWPAASQAVAALALCCVGITLLSKGRWVGALAAFVASALAYEFTIPIAMVASVLVGTRWLPVRPGLTVVREVRHWQRAVLVAGLLGAVWWTARHPKYPVEWRPPDAWDTWSAHVSTGLFATESAPTLVLRALELAVAFGIVWCAIAWARGCRSREKGPALTLAGAAVMALGLVTTVLLPGLTIGLSNRLYGASSVGTAMVLTGLVVTLWHRRRTVGVAVGTALVALCAFGQVVALRAAHRGGEDVLAMMRFLPTSMAEPAEARFLVAPRPEHDGFYAVDHFFGLYPYKLAYPDGGGRLRLAADQAEYEDPEPGEVRITWEEILADPP